MKNLKSKILGYAAGLALLGSLANPAPLYSQSTQDTKDDQKTETPAIFEEPTNTLNANIEFIQSAKQGGSYVRPNISANLTDNITTRGFAELYEGGNYFAKTNTSMNLYENTGLRLQTNTVNGKTNAGIGLETNITNNDNFTLSAFAIPAFINQEGNLVDDKRTLGYFAQINAPLDFRIGSFGEINIGKNTQWSYGEAFITNDALNDALGNFSISYQPSLTNRAQQDVVPELTHRLSLTYNFK
ncbi:MAG: hypothetical protein ACMXX7_02345 [Candidatus Woesearchaeota archaeon]